MTQECVCSQPGSRLSERLVCFRFLEHLLVGRGISSISHLLYPSDRFSQFCYIAGLLNFQRSQSHA